MNPILFVGGPADGRTLPTAPKGRYVRIPVMGAARVLGIEEFDDPANWEWDDVMGRWRIKRPPITDVCYEFVDGELRYVP